MQRLVISTCLAAVLAVATSDTLAVQLGSRPTEEWIKRLERPERVAELKTDAVVEKLRLKEGDAVADIGAGPGVFSWPLARAVAPRGTVYAVEVDQGFITHLEQRAREHQLTNVRPVLGKYDDPLLPEKIDLAFFHDVLHHIDKRDAYLKTVASYLKPGGRIAIIELDATRPNASHRNNPHLQVTKEKLQEWMTAAGLERVEEIPMFDDKWFVVYRKKQGA